MLFSSAVYKLRLSYYKYKDIKQQTLSLREQVPLLR